MPDLSIPPGHDRPGVPRGAPGLFVPALAALLAVALPAAAIGPEDPPGGAIRVPLDHQRRSGPALELYYELGAPFDPGLPTVLVVADGQQFYVRRGAMAGLQATLFGPGMNVAGLVGRGFTPEAVRAALGPDGRPDWEKAWRLFRAEQWIEDLEALRVALVGRRGPVLLFGQSGGALLARQYLARHGARVRRAVTAVPVEPFLVGELGLATDRFWAEIGAADPALRQEMRAALSRFASDRLTLAMTLQRQNFFVPPDRIDAERARLIRALAAGDTDTYTKARAAYQVEEVRALLDLADGIPSRVRLYELFQPSGALDRLEGGGFHPDLENQRAFAAPLLDLLARGRIEAPALDRGALHRLDAEVLVIGGRRDHTVDYRTLIAQAAGYAHGTLFLADDDHMLGRMKEDGSLAALTTAFLGAGPGSPEWAEALRGAAAHRFVEP